MKPINTLLTILFMSLLSSPSWSLTFDDLVKRDGLYYKKFTDAPFTGKVTGDEHGTMKNRKWDGAWVVYWSNGQLFEKGNYKNGVRDGARVYYHEDGTVDKEYTGTYKDGVKISDWVNSKLIKGWRKASYNTPKSPYLRKLESGYFFELSLSFLFISKLASSKTQRVLKMLWETSTAPPA